LQIQIGIFIPYLQSEGEEIRQFVF